MDKFHQPEDFSNSHAFNSIHVRAIKTKLICFAPLLTDNFMPYNVIW